MLLFFVDDGVISVIDSCQCAFIRWGYSSGTCTSFRTLETILCCPHMGWRVLFSWPCLTGLCRLSANLIVYHSLFTPRLLSFTLFIFNSLRLCVFHQLLHFQLSTILICRTLLILLKTIQQGKYIYFSPSGSVCLTLPCSLVLLSLLGERLDPAILHADPEEG